jgi:hypothetical protein
VTLLSPKVELFVNAAWTDVTAYVRVTDGVVIVRGRQDEQGTLQAGTCTMTLDNRDGRFSPRNPTGAYYGTIGRNTPVRVSVGGVYRFYGEISAWPPRWAVSQKDAWVTVQGAGLTRRLTQGPKPLRGPISRYVTAASNVIAYWPCDDAQGASSIASGITNGTAMTFDSGPTQVRLAADSTFPTTDPLIILNSAGVQGAPNTNAAGSTYAHFLLSVPVAGDTNDTTLFRVLESNGSARWEIRYFTASTGSLLLRCFDNLGASLLTSTSLTGLNGVPSVITLSLSQSGGNVTYTLSAYVFATGVVQTVTGTIADTKTSVSAIQVNADHAGTSMVIGQILVTTTDQVTAVVNAMRGYSGETAGTRFVRLCTEEGITSTTVGTLSTSEPMGSQTAMTLMELLNQCEATDGGYLYEPKDSLALAYRTRNSMYASAPDLTIAYTNMDTLEPVDDDYATRNKVQVSRIGGSSATYEVTTGRLSTSAPPTGVGRYDVNYDLSMASDTRDLAIAEWRAALGTLDEPRYPVLGLDINLLAAGATKTAAIAVDIGASLKVTSPPIWVPRTSLQGLVIGYTETITQTAWRLDFNCAQGSPWAAAFTLDSTTLGRLDSASTTVNGAHTSTTTTITYTTTEPWVTTVSEPAAFPFGITVGGEDMTVTAATATTFTVTRSVNGVVKAQTSGTEIHLTQQNRIML